MYVKRVVLENIRGFPRLDLKFERSDRTYQGWWVVTGDNAAGKTALLKSIAMALIGPDAIRSLQPSLAGWIRHGESHSVVAVEIVAGEKDQFRAGRPFTGPFWSELSLSLEEGPEIKLGIGNLYKGNEKGPTYGPWAVNPSGWFCAGYGPFRRLSGDSPEAQRVMSSMGRVARFATMFKEDAALSECEIWLKELHHKSLEGHTRESHILNNVVSLLNDDFLQNGLKVERVDSAGLWIRQRNGIVLPLTDMSEGYRAALAMLIDLLRHLIDIHGEEFVKESNGKFEVPHSGVVLIDEIDAHLHPEWQRKIGFWLRSRFPKLQFIVTTHSPMICQAADSDGIFYLPPPGSSQEPEQITGSDYQNIIRGKPDEILRGPAFRVANTRSDKAVNARVEFARLKSKQQGCSLSEDETLKMTQLEMFVGANGELD